MKRRRPINGLRVRNLKLRKNKIRENLLQKRFSNNFLPNASLRMEMKVKNVRLSLWPIRVMKRHDLIQNNKSLVKVNIQMIQSRRQWMTISSQQTTWARLIDPKKTGKLVSRKRYPFKLVKKQKNKRQISIKIKSKWANLKWFWRVCGILTYLRTK